MTQKANPTAIGAFLIGATMLIISGVLFFSGGYFFGDKQRFLLVFDGTVQGLNVGAPISLKGVKIGEVKKIDITFYTDDLKILTLVTAEVNRDNITKVGRYEEGEVFIDDLIKKGLRGKLKLQSLLTGLLYIEFNFYPDTTPNYHQIKSKLPEVPVLPTDMELLSRILQDFDLAKVLDNIESISQGLDDYVSDPALKNLAKEVKELVTSAEYAVSDDSPILHKLKKATDEISRASASLRQLTDSMERNPESILKGKPNE